MSKESYARGFCKAAEAAGIDPVALVKYAQQYKTDGWVPDVARVDGIPMLSPASFVPRNAGKETSTIGSASDLATGHPEEPYFDAMRALSPRLDSYWSAHTNSLEKLRNIVLPHFRDWENNFRMAHGNKLSKKEVYDAMNANGYYDREGPLKRLMEQEYAKTMRDSTGTSARVSAPIKK